MNEIMYRFNHFNLGVMLGDMRFSRNALRPGAYVTDAPVTTLNGERTNLLHLAENRKILLITGSITCPMTISSLEYLKKVYQDVKDKLEIVLLYVREAHPGENIPQPQTIEQKTDNALKFQAYYDIPFPVVVDDLDGGLHKQLDVLPNSVHLLDCHGKILSQSLWAGDGEYLEDVVARVSLDDEITERVSQRMFVPFMQGAGYMHDTLKFAGDRSYRELALGAPPIALLSKTASLFTWLPEEKRGLAGMALVGVMAVAVVVFLSVYT